MARGRIAKKQRGAVDRLPSGALRVRVSAGIAISWDPEKRVWYEKDTKTHQQRRVALDPVTVDVLTEHRERCDKRAAAVGSSLGREAFMFSLVNSRA